MLNPVQLQALAEVVRTGSFVEAGKTLGYTSSAVSQQVSALERTLGLRLVVREAHGVRCTPTAQRLADRGVHALGFLAALEDDVRALASGQAGRLRIGTSLDPDAGLIAPLLRELKASHPRVQPSVSDQTPERLVEGVRAGSVDIALIYDYPAAPRALPPELAFVELARNPWVLVTPAEWHDGTALVELAVHEWVVGLDVGLGHRALSVVCASEGFTPRISATSRNSDVVLGLVSARSGVGVLPATPRATAPGVRLRPFTTAGATRRTLAVHQCIGAAASVETAVRALQHLARLPSCR